MTLSEELTWRGFINQMTFADITDLDKEPRTFYFGVDPSADSMQVGNLAAAMMVRCFIDHGYVPILLVGGATGLIGDPDGQKQERDLKPVEEIERNVQGIVSQYKTVFAGKDFELVNNNDWFKNMGYMEFLRSIGKHVSLTQMLDREFVQSRVGEGGAGISYAEFSYSLIQGYDFLHLYREKGATLQLAGADQWGNSIAGVSLIRKLEGAEAHVFTVPLVINKATGVKFGKSESGAVWLDERKTSVYAFYQFWLGVDDAGVIDYMKIYTLLSRDDIERLEKAVIEHPEHREAQKILAFEVTKLVHGEEKARMAQNVTGVLFGDVPFAGLPADDIDMLASEIPVSAPSTLVGVLVSSGVCASNGDARRLIAGGGVSVNGEKITEDRDVAAPSLIKKGKNSFVLVREHVARQAAFKR